MRIAEAAQRCGLSEDTIRYYEKSGMVPAIGRDARGHRVFNARNIEWLTLLYWLRETGMSMKQMRRFTYLAQEGTDEGAGEEAVAERRDILIEHSNRLRERRALLDRCEAVLAIKIASYGGTGTES